MLRIECPGCASVFRVSEQHAGKRAHCPKCRAQLEVPHLEQDLEDEPEPEAAPEPADPLPSLPQGRLLPALMAALGAAFVGAVAWALISGWTHYEIGYVAWAVGGIVGLATWTAGGRGAGIAIASAFLALAGIAGGKLGAAWVVRKSALDDVGSHFTRELYAEYLRDAQDWSEIPSDPDRALVAEFMVEHDYSESDAASQVSDEELFSFWEQSVPMLGALQRQPPGYEAWAEQRSSRARLGMQAAFPLLDMVRDDLDSFDLLWGLLGVSTAFGLIVRWTGEEQAASRAPVQTRRRTARPAAGRTPVTGSGPAAGPGGRRRGTRPGAGSGPRG